MSPNTSTSLLRLSRLDARFLGKAAQITRPLFRRIQKLNMPNMRRQKPRPSTTSTVVYLVAVAVFTLTLPLAAQHSRKERVLVHVIKPWHKWLDEDVRWIITDEERGEFKKLTTDQQRDEFVESFWQRRSPNPRSEVNAFKEEHYLRIAFANLHFASGKRLPGWKTDRGRFYIMYGPPDSIDSSPGFSPPSEAWHYKYIEGLGRDIVLNFVDECRCADYQLTLAWTEDRRRNFDPLGLDWVR